MIQKFLNSQTKSISSASLILAISYLISAFLGLIRDYDIEQKTKNLIIEIQDRIFTAESLLAVDPEKIVRNLPVLLEYDIELLEIEIDKMNVELPEISNFILPGGHKVVSICHIARTICRRGERCVIKLVEHQPKTIQSEMILKYLNRLSDFLFVLSRKLSKDFNATETPWSPKY